MGRRSGMCRRLPVKSGTQAHGFASQASPRYRVGNAFCDLEQLVAVSLLWVRHSRAVVALVAEAVVVLVAELAAVAIRIEEKARRGAAAHFLRFALAFGFTRLRDALGSRRARHVVLVTAVRIGSLVVVGA